MIHNEFIMKLSDLTLQDKINIRTEKRAAKIKKAVEKRQPTLTVVLENIWDPHNVSACFRSCDAVGILEICLVYDGSQEFPKLKERSSASARKWVDSMHYTSIEECYADLRREGKKIFATHMAKDAVSLYDINLSDPVALVFGNEHSGVSEKAVKLADGNFLIPQAGMIQSLNISVAVAVSVYEAHRQRLVAGMYDSPQLAPDQFDQVFENWLDR